MASNVTTWLRLNPVFACVVVIFAHPWVARQREIVDAARDLKNKLCRHVRQDMFFVSFLGHHQH